MSFPTIWRYENYSVIFSRHDPPAYLSLVVGLVRVFGIFAGAVHWLNGVLIKLFSILDLGLDT